MFSSLGSLWLHSGSAMRQRGWKRQPGGGLIGFGGSPESGATCVRCVGSMDGTEATRACVYGCVGLPSTVRDGPISATRPRYITKTRSEMKRTTSHNNNRVCDALPGEEPAMSGAGVAILGADHITIRHNTVTANRPAADSAFAGGIIVGSAPGGDPSNNVTVTRNEAEGNTPADIVWDGTGTAISFTRNDCDTSTPGGLCS